MVLLVFFPAVGSSPRIFLCRALSHRGWKKLIPENFPNFSPELLVFLEDGG